MYCMLPLLCWLATSAVCFSTLNAQSVPYSVSSVQGSNIISNYYDPNATQATGPGLAPSTVVNQFNQPLGKPLNGSASLPISSTAPVSGASAVPLAPINLTSSAMTSTTPVTGTTAIPAIGSNLTPQATKLGTAATPSVVPGTAPVQIQALAPAAVTGKEGLPSRIEEPTYTFPGLVARLGRHWVGSDYLFQIPGHIGVVVEVVQSDTSHVPVNTVQIKHQVMQVFSQGGITPQAIAYANDPPLPFFHVLIFVTATPDHGIASISGRLFEKVSIDRFHFELPGSWQAITWEQQDMVMSSLQQISEQIVTTSLDIAKNFVHKVNYFLDLRVQQESDVKLKGGPVFAPINPISQGPNIPSHGGSHCGARSDCRGCQMICR